MWGQRKGARAERWRVTYHATLRLERLERGLPCVVAWCGALTRYSGTYHGGCRYADYLDICAAITARVPAAGPHLDEERIPTVVVDVQDIVETVAAEVGDAFYPALGYLVGNAASTSNRTPYLHGSLLQQATTNVAKVSFCTVLRGPQPGTGCACK